jgi:hypothetical protein
MTCCVDGPLSDQTNKQTLSHLLRLLKGNQEATDEMLANSGRNHFHPIMQCIKEGQKITQSIALWK